MEEEKEWKGSEEKDEEIAEEVNGSLERRKKKKGSTGAVDGERHSVFFEADEGVWKCRHCTWTYHLSGPGIDLIQNHKSDFQVVMDSHMLNKLGTRVYTSTKGAEFNKDKDFPRLGEKNEIFVSENTIQNGNASIEANDLITHNTVDAKEDNHHELGNIVPKSHYGSAVNNGNESRRNEDEIQECIELKPEVQTKLIVEGYDVEKIIGEQETHDLFCPNCHSCITKRVILRKRKRTRENKNDLPPKKVQHIPEVNPASVEVVDQEDKTTVFRCLSCLSFFIPTEGSFNIFRLFGLKDGSNNSRNSEKKLTQNENQVPLLSGSKNNDNRAGVPLFAEENNVISSRDPSSHLKDNSSSMHTAEAMNLEAKENKNGINDTVMGDSYPSHGQMFDQDQKYEPNYSAATMLPESYSTGVQMNNSAQQAKPAYASIVSKDTSAEKQTSDGASMENMEQEDKHSFPHTIAQNNMLDTSIGIPDPTGGLKGNETQGDKTRYPVQAISEGVPLFAEENNVMSCRDPSSHLKDNSSMHTVEAMNLEAKENKNGINDTVMGDSYPSHGQMFDQDQKNEQNYSATTMLPESYSNGVQMNNSAQQAKPPYASIVSKDYSAQKQTSDGALMENMEQDKHSFPHTIVQNNMLDTSIGIPKPTGGIKGNETKGDKTRYPMQAVSEGPSNGATYTNGIVIGTPGGNPSNLASIISDGVYTSNANLYGSSVAVTGNDVTKPVNLMQPATPIRATTENNQISYGSDATNATDTLIDMGTPGMVSSGRAYEWDILKSIVYGGLIESIMSLSLVASAAGAGSSTINICALGLANLVGGLFLLAHDLSELRIRHDAETGNQIGQQPSQYWEKLGKREHAKRHICISVLSFIIFGALPPIVYAFAFRQSNHKEHKIIAMAISSLFCIAVLGAGKAHVKSQNGYLKSVFYYLGIALPASGLSYVAGVMIHRLFVQLSLFDPTINPPPPQLLSSY